MRTASFHGSAVVDKISLKEHLNCLKYFIPSILGRSLSAEERTTVHEILHNFMNESNREYIDSVMNKMSNIKSIDDIGAVDYEIIFLIASVLCYETENELVDILIKRSQIGLANINANENNIPNEIHFAWEGGDISENDLTNILLLNITAKNYKINVWTTRPMSIFSTLERMKTSENNSLSRFLAHKFGESIIINNTHDLYNELSEKFKTTNKDYRKIPDGKLLQSMFYREINGAYKNYAAASDITRAVLMFLKGGVYMDTDVTIPSLKPLSNDDAPLDYLIFKEGDIRGLPNAMLASAPGSDISREILETMARNLSQSNVDLWTQKRCNKESRRLDTMKLTGPGLLFASSIDQRTGVIFNTTELQRIENYEYKPDFSSIMKPDADEIFFRGTMGKFKGNGEWAKTSHIKNTKEFISEQ